MDFSSAIKTLRVKCLMSQTEFAEKIGVAFSTVNRWENNKAVPNFQTMKKIMDFCEENDCQLELDISLWRGAI